MSRTPAVVCTSACLHARSGKAERSFFGDMAFFTVNEVRQQPAALDPHRSPCTPLSLMARTAHDSGRAYGVRRCAGNRVQCLRCAIRHAAWRACLAHHRLLRRHRVTPAPQGSRTRRVCLVRAPRRALGTRQGCRHLRPPPLLTRPPALVCWLGCRPYHQRHVHLGSQAHATVVRAGGHVPG